MSFAKGLDALLGLEEKAPAVPHGTDAPSAHDPDAPEDEFVPEAAPDEDAAPAPPDAFRDMVDAALAAEGVDVKKERRRTFDPIRGDVFTHEWEMQREVLFSGEKYQFRCKRCLKSLNVAGDQTMGAAVLDQGVDPNCGEQVVKDVDAL